LEFSAVWLDALNCLNQQFLISLLLCATKSRIERLWYNFALFEISKTGNETVFVERTFGAVLTSDFESNHRYDNSSGWQGWRWRDNVLKWSTRRRFSVSYRRWLPELTAKHGQSAVAFSELAGGRSSETDRRLRGMSSR
jgi:hypothetical protein